MTISRSSYHSKRAKSNECQSFTHVQMLNRRGNPFGHTEEPNEYPRLGMGYRSPRWNIVDKSEARTYVLTIHCIVVAARTSYSMIITNQILMLTAYWHISYSNPAFIGTLPNRTFVDRHQFPSSPAQQSYPGKFPAVNTGTKDPSMPERVVAQEIHYRIASMTVPAV